jgi:hypothetical protein
MESLRLECVMAMLRILLTVLALVSAPPLGRAAEPVDLLLVLAADVSRSVDQPKFQLQRDGYAAAINDPRVINAIMSGARRRIAICFVEWSGAGAQKVVIDWMIVDGPDAARKFSDALVEAPRSFADRTSISGAIDFAMEMLSRAPFEAPRRTIDISGDGTHNSGRGLLAAREDALATGVTINGLVILSERPLPWNPEHTNPPGGLPKYFEDNVIGGPGAFVAVAESFESFGQALISKLIAEIAHAPASSTTGLAARP